MKDDTKYDLTEEEFQRSLSIAELATFMNAQGVEKPKSIFVVAQPGAGKTALKAYTKNIAQSNGYFLNPIEFNPDEISVHHKYYKEIMEEFPNDSYRILQRFTRPALDNYLRQRAVEFKCDIIQEGTFASTQGYIDIIDFQRNGGYSSFRKIPFNSNNQDQKFVQGGYNIEINCLAVNRFESLLSCFEREQYFIEMGLPPRSVTIENHDRAYENMLNTIDLIEEGKMFDKIQVFRRGKIEDRPELIYDEKEKKYPKVSDFIKLERKRQEKELFNNPDIYIERLNSLRKKVKQNKDNNSSLLDRINKLEEIFKEELEKYKNSKEDYVH